MGYHVNGDEIAADEEGYLTDLSVWSPELADVIAKEENINMSTIIGKSSISSGIITTNTRSLRPSAC